MGAGMIITACLKVNKKDCLHCGEHTADYCLECHQKVVKRNQELLRDKGELETENKNLSHIIKAMKSQRESLNQYIIDLEHIRDAYFLDKDRENGFFNLEKEQEEGNHIPRLD